MWLLQLNLEPSLDVQDLYVFPLFLFTFSLKGDSNSVPFKITHMIRHQRYSYRSTYTSVLAQ